MSVPPSVARRSSQPTPERGDPSSSARDDPAPAADALEWPRSGGVPGMAEYPRAPEGWVVASRRSSGPFATEVTFAHPDGDDQLVLAASPQARLAALRTRPAGPRPVGAAPRLLVDRGAVHARLELLPRRAAARPSSPGSGRRPTARSSSSGPSSSPPRRPAVAGDHQRRPRPPTAPVAGPSASARLGAAPHRLVEQRRPAPRDALLQRHDVPGADHRRSAAAPTTGSCGGRTPSARCASWCPGTSPTSR